MIRHKYKDEKGKFKVDYELLEEPKPTTENPSPPATENPTSDNPKSENPTSEKPSSKKERNTNKEIVIEEEQKEAPLPFINSLEKLLFITPLAGDKEIQNLYKMFRENREQTKNKLTANAEVLFFGVLRDIPINRKKYEKDIAVAMIKNTVSKNWRGLFQLKDHEADEIFKKNKIEEAKKRIEPTEEQKKNHRNIQEVQEITRYKDTLGEKEREELRKQAEEEVKKVAPSIAGTLLETMIKTAENRIVRGRIYTK